MFATITPDTARSRSRRSPVPPTLAARVRPISSTGDRLLPLEPPFTPLFPDGALRRGTTVLVTGDPGRGGTTLAFGLLAAALIVYTHRSNIGRMRCGTEPRARRLWLFGARARSS